MPERAGATDGAAGHPEATGPDAWEEDRRFANLRSEQLESVGELLVKGLQLPRGGGVDAVALRSRLNATGNGADIHVIIRKGGISEGDFKLLHTATQFSDSGLKCILLLSQGSNSARDSSCESS